MDQSVSPHVWHMQNPLGIFQQIILFFVGCVTPGLLDSNEHVPFVVIVVI